MTLELFERLERYWRQHGAVRLEGVSPDRLAAFEKRYEIELPSDFREYWLHMDGMDVDGRYPRPRNGQGDKDHIGFSFWPLERVYRASEGRPPREDPWSFPGSTEYFLFADYREWSWAYAIGLAGASRNRVVIVGTGNPQNDPQQIAQSFTAFVELYLSDPPRLFVKR